MWPPRQLSSVTSITKVYGRQIRFRSGVTFTKLYRLGAPRWGGGAAGVPVTSKPFPDEAWGTVSQKVCPAGAKQNQKSRYPHVLVAYLLGGGLKLFYFPYIDNNHPN